MPHYAHAMVSMVIRSNFDMMWFKVAAAHCRAAQEARERAEASADGSPEMAQAFGDELEATMVVVAAAAFAIDALYVKVDELLDPTERTRARGRVGRIVETFKIALTLGKRGARWQESIPELFDLRDELVHFRAEDHPPQPHPTGKSNVSRESSFYSLEKATWAFDLAHEVLTIAYTSPRAEHTELVAWAKSVSHVPEYFGSLHRG